MIWTNFKNENRIPQKIVHRNMEGKHTRGRPRLRWKQQITKYVYVIQKKKLRKN
jgi:hypothetical protein